MAAWRDTDGLTGLQMVDLPPVWLLGFLVSVWVIAQVLPGAVLPMPGGPVIGGVLALVGIGLMVWALAAFRQHQTSVVPHKVPQRIITTGPFAISRNPIYLGDVLVLAGVVLWQGVWLAAPLIPLFVWVIARRFISPEEVRMKENFGAEFARYQSKTRRWL